MELKEYLISEMKAIKDEMNQKEIEIYSSDPKAQTTEKQLDSLTKYSRLSGKLAEINKIIKFILIHEGGIQQ